MGEENQNIVQNTGTTETEKSPIRFLADSLQSRKDSIRQNVNATSTQQNQAELENLYEKSMTSDNVDSCRGYDFECRKGEFAFYLKEKGKEAGRNTEGIANDDLLDSYIWNTENPQLTYNIMKDYIMHPEETDIKPYLVRLGWMEPTEEEETANWFERVAKDFYGAFELFGKGVRNFSTGAGKKFDGVSGTEEAISEYMYDKYGNKHIFTPYSQDEIDEVTRDIRIDPSILDAYKGEQRMDTAISDMAAGGTFATIETLAMSNPRTAGLTLGLFGAAETPYIDVIPEGLAYLTARLGEVPYDVALQITKYIAPDVYKYLLNYPAEKKENMFMMAGGWIFGKYLKSNTGKDTLATGKGLWNKMKEFFKKPGMQKEVITDLDKFNEMMLKNGGNKDLSIEEQQSLKNMNRKSNRVVNSDTVAENTDISKALTKLDKNSLKKIKTYEELFNLNEKRVKKIENYQNTIAESIDKKRGPENDVWDVDVRNGEYIGEGEPNHPIKEFIDKMELMTKDSDPTTRKALNTIKQKYINKDINAQDITNFKRILSRQFDLYKYGKEGVELKVSKNDIETTRRGLNKLLRDAVEGIPEFKDIGIGNVFEWTDSEFSPSLHLRGRLIDLVNKVNKLQGQIPADAWKGELGAKLGKLTSLKGWLETLAGWLGGKGKGKMTNALDYQEKLNMHLKDFAKLMDDLPSEQAQMIESAMLDYLKRLNGGAKEVYGGNLGEGEVIDGGIFGKDFGWEEEVTRNKYLEDYVEVVEPDAPGFNTLEENSNYNGQEPIDYTTPTRVTPEGYAGRRGQTIESYKNLLKDSGFTDKQVEAVMSILDKNGFKIGDQPSLFEDMPSLDEAKEMENSKKKSNGKNKK